ncbi:hypothetical protein L210DRAFT_948044 [Boletus edulis BED1]|uniref:Uncharacterized protein n=1 Tax=Boletus edulis BED1 TaxID=1328754 RepID=A0AAD4BI63_BOLED|nr:hypothetical protein L210DRAFT_948044 [Boletus edulis BED1]
MHVESGRQRKECARAVFQFLVRISVHSSRKRRGMRGTMNMETWLSSGSIREADTSHTRNPIFKVRFHFPPRGPQRDPSILLSLGFYPLYSPCNNLKGFWQCCTVQCHMPRVHDTLRVLMMNRHHTFDLRLFLPSICPSDDARREEWETRFPTSLDWSAIL